jgi:hypothetical protein
MILDYLGVYSSLTKFWSLTATSAAQNHKNNTVQAKPCKEGLLKDVLYCQGVKTTLSYAQLKMIFFIFLKTEFVPIGISPPSVNMFDLVCQAERAGFFAVVDER